MASEVINRFDSQGRFRIREGDYVCGLWASYGCPVVTTIIVVLPNECEPDVWLILTAITAPGQGTDRMPRAFVGTEDEAINLCIEVMAGLEVADDGYKSLYLQIESFDMEVIADRFEIAKKLMG